ncbi:hypothetical protein GCM10022235_14660 [Kribbella ginsengisoli]|uniref:Uncharacterized protein n=1 Tax=Kribbella ginsengisoli TaxID=363865 RepID=A0ABP6W922_9ACTN
MQVQDQAKVQRLPVLLEQVVQSLSVAGELLLTPVAQLHHIAIDDSPRPPDISHHYAFDGRRRSDALNPGTAGKLGQQSRELMAVESLAASTCVDRPEMHDDVRRYLPDEPIEVREGAHLLNLPKEPTLILIEGQISTIVGFFR